MKTIIFILASFLLAGEMQVDGDLTVLGNVNAPGLGGMKPDRIYSFDRGSGSGGEPPIIAVPENKLWIIHIADGGISIRDDTGSYLNSVSSGHDGGQRSHALIPGTEFQVQSGGVSFYILEYPISGTGTDHGMDYVEP